MSAPDHDAHFMDLALLLGRRGMGRSWPNPAVGAVIACEAAAAPVIVGRGWTQPGGRPHAERAALLNAVADVRGGTLYVTLEPCSHHGRGPPCADAVITAGIRRVVSALEDPNPHVIGAGHERLRAAGIVVEVGLREAEARDVHAGHIMRMRHGRPYVTLKMAVSSDEKVGLAGRRPVAISGEEARSKLHLMRAESDAILIGIGTALADDPLLTCRLPGMGDRSPVRVVLDYALDLPLSSRLVETAGDVPVWLIAGEAADRDKAGRLGSRSVEVLFAQQARPQPGEVLRLLAARGITRVLMEGGPKTASAFLRADLVDQAILSRSPMIIGSDGIAAFEGLPLAFVCGQQNFTQTQVEQIGQDRFETYRRNG